MAYSVRRRIDDGDADYWDHATLLELAVLGENEDAAVAALTDAVAANREPWEAETTLNNIREIARTQQRRGRDTAPAKLASIGVQGLDPGEWKAVRMELLAATYGPLVERLATELSVVGLPYDWRESLTVPIERLVVAVGAVEVGPVHLLGHGAGGLVIRAALLAEPGLAERLGHVPVLGTPNLGSLALVRAAAGQGDLVECLAMIDPEARSARCRGCPAGDGVAA